MGRQHNINSLIPPLNAGLSIYHKSCLRDMFYMDMAGGGTFATLANCDIPQTYITVVQLYIYIYIWTRVSVHVSCVHICGTLKHTHLAEQGRKHYTCMRQTTRKPRLREWVHAHTQPATTCNTAHICNTMLLTAAKTLLDVAVAGVVVVVVATIWLALQKPHIAMRRCLCSAAAAAGLHTHTPRLAATGNHTHIYIQCS